MEWYYDFPDFVRPLGPNGRLRLAVLQADSKQLDLRANVQVYDPEDKDADTAIIHSTTLNFSSETAVRRFAVAVAERWLRRTGALPADGLVDLGVLQPYQKDIEQQLAQIRVALQQEGDRQQRAWLENLNKPAEPISAAERQALWEAAAELALAPDLWDRIDAVLARIVVGEERNRQLLYLIMVSRLLERPVNAVIRGLSSGGKSHLALAVRQFFPQEMVHVFTAMSARALVYTPRSLRHTCLLLLEASALDKEGLASMILRTLLSEGHVIYDVVRGGVTETVVREGPTGFLSTTTQAAVEFQLENRVLSPQIDDSRLQTRAILAYQGRIAARKMGSLPDLSPYLALQRWLQSLEVHDAEIPFGEDLAAHMPDHNMRVRRDFPSTLNLVAASALLHYAQREKNAEGLPIATRRDYEIVQEAMGEPFSTAQSGLTQKQREAIASIAKLLAVYPQGVPLHAISTDLGIDHRAARQRLRTPMHLGYVRDVSTRGQGRIAHLTLGDPLPELDALPHPSALFGPAKPPTREMQR